MIRKFTLLTTIAFLFTFPFLSFAQTQTVITGIITNNAKENIDAVSITIKGGTAGTYTDSKGKFRLVTTQKPPFTILISSVGYADTSAEITSDNQSIAVQLQTSYALGQDVVVSASRVPERILESPVSIERISNATIVNTPTNTYYDILRTIPGVDMTTSSLTFQTPSTRGFNGSGNVRLNQIVDGMDNQAPGLNFSVGSVIGLTELDVDNMELLEGASSALYGPGGMNGTLIINSKDPYKYQGLSAEIKEGVMNINSPAANTSSSLYQDYTLRWAQKVGDKFAFKISGEYITANDWVASDSSDYNALSGMKIPGTRSSDPNYNGVNVYGDETTQNLASVNSSILAGIEQAVGAPTYNAIYGASSGYLQAKSQLLP